jgi:hypothetical protein
MRVTHFSEIISDSFLSFSLITHTHIRLDTARVLLMIDGAQQVTRVILRQVALNTPEPYRNLCVCVCDAVSIVFVLMVRACALASIDLAELILILREK